MTIQNSNTTQTIAFLGAGNMATAIVQGLYSTGNYQFLVSEPYQPALTRWQSEFNALSLYDAKAITSPIDAVVLAVKPQHFKEAALSLYNPAFNQSYLSPNTVIISIMAGVSIETIQTAFKGHSAVVRTMPNTPARIKQGITGLYATPDCTEFQIQLAQTLMSSIGKTVFVNSESLLDAVTAVSGSGPAYLFYIAQSMVDAGVSLGLSEAVARELTLVTLQGSAALARECGEDLNSLREQVTSKGGTTAAALNVLQTHQVNQSFHEALTAAYERAKALALLN